MEMPSWLSSSLTARERLGCATDRFSAALEMEPVREISRA
jgi:hypothetical protein